MPVQDALSKTIPIWAAVVNRAVGLFRDKAGKQPNVNPQPIEDSAASPTPAAETVWDTKLCLPPWVPAGEAMQIEQLIDGWAAELLQVTPLTAHCQRHR